MLSGCRGSQSALDPAGPQAGRIGGLWWLMLYTLTGVYLVVMAFVVASVLRRRGRAADAPERKADRSSEKDAAQSSAVGADESDEDDAGSSSRPSLIAPDVRPAGARERRMARAVGAGVAATVVILFVLLVASFLTGRGLYAITADQSVLTVRVTARQWWWEVRYDNPNPAWIVTTANEIHVPVGQTVQFRLASNDVIHSFWVPNLHGKMDIIPGRETHAWLRADRAGTYRGQCAEFCGHQHAHMAFTLVAEPPEQFKAWYDAQLLPAARPATPQQARGQAVFLSSPCVMCHRVMGTDAGGTVGPDLTHVASRPHLAAGTLQNTRGHLAGWIVDSQKIKPGNRMPPNNLEPQDLNALLDYLQSLK